LNYPYDGSVYTVSNLPLANSTLLNYIPLDYWICNTPLSSYQSINDNLYAFDLTPNLYCKSRDSISQMKIINTNFNTIDLQFPDKSVFPVINPYGYSGSMFDFMGTNSLTISGNIALTSANLDIRTFRGLYYTPTYVYRTVNIKDNANLLSAALLLRTRTDDVTTNNSFTDRIFINLCNNNINTFTLTSYNIPIDISTDGTNYFNPATYIEFYVNTTLTDSQKLKTASLTGINYNLYYLYLSAIDKTLYTSYELVSVAPSSYSEYLDYSNWNVLKNNISVVETTLSSYKTLNIEGYKDAIRLQRNVNFNYNFVDILSSTLVDMVTSTKYYRSGYPPIAECMFTSQPIPAEIYNYYANLSNGILDSAIYRIKPTNPNTLFTYQSNILTQPLSGKRAPWTAYRPVSGSQSINSNFILNKSATYNWPLSVLNNINRMAFYQGPFADAPLPHTLIHPRYAITAEHWVYGKSYPYNTSFFNTNTNTSTNVVVVSSQRIPNTDLRIIKLQTPLLSSSFPGMYMIPKSLYQSNTATKIPPILPCYFFSQDYDIVYRHISQLFIGKTFSQKKVIYDNAAFLSTKILRQGESGHPTFTFINNKPVILGVETSGTSGPSTILLTNEIQSLVNQLEGSTVNLNFITQSDLDVYDNYSNYVG